MKDFRWDNKTVRRNGILVLLLVTIFMVVHEIFGDHGYLALRRQKQEYHKLQQQIQVLQRDNAQLKQRIHALKTNPAAIEKQARDQLHLAKPGEIIYTLPGKELDSRPADVKNAPPPNSTASR